MAKATIEGLEAAEADWIVTAGASCAVAITHDYHQLFADEPDWLARAEALAARTLDLTSFLTRVARLPDGALAAPGGEPVTYHNFCQSHNVLGLKEEPRDLIERVMGLELVELPEAAVCCGFGGSVSADYPELSERHPGAQTGECGSDRRAHARHRQPRLHHAPARRHGRLRSRRPRPAPRRTAGRATACPLP